MTDSVIPPNTPVVISRGDAKAQGLKRYFDGKVCRNGHVAERLVSTTACVACSRAAVAAYYKRNPEKARAATATWRARNLEDVRKADAARAAEKRKRDPEKVKAINLAWRERNRGYLRGLATQYRAEKPEILKAWRAANPDKVREQKARHAAKHSAKCAAKAAEWREKHPERHRANARAYAIANPEKVLAAHATRRARKLAAEGYYTAEDIRRIYEKQKGRCACCGKDVGKKYHRDHIVPLSRGGSNWPRNIQITCPPCNLKKRDKDPVTFMQSLGRLL